MSETKSNEKKIKYHIHPTRFFDYDIKNRKWELEVQLPGIDKEKIHFKVLKNAYHLEAYRGKAVYHLSESFPFDVVVDTVEGEYDNGLLVVKGEIKDPMEEAVEIKLSE